MSEALASGLVPSGDGPLGQIQAYFETVTRFISSKILNSESLVDGPSYIFVSLFSYILEPPHIAYIP